MKFTNKSNKSGVNCISSSVVLNTRIINLYFFRFWMQTIVITSNGNGFYFYVYMEIRIQTHLSNGKLKSVNYLDSP